MKKIIFSILAVLIFNLSFNAIACFTPPQPIKDTGLMVLAGYVSNENGDELYDSGYITSLGIDYEIIIVKDDLNSKLELTSTVVYNPKSHEKLTIIKVLDRRLPQPRGSINSAGMSRSSRPSIQFGGNYTQHACGIR